jgi:hypothetical protein
MAVAVVVGEMVQRREISRKRRSKVLRWQCAFDGSGPSLGNAPSHPRAWEVWQCNRGMFWKAGKI